MCNTANFKFLKYEHANRMSAQESFSELAFWKLHQHLIITSFSKVWIIDFVNGDHSINLKAGRPHFSAYQVWKTVMQVFPRTGFSLFELIGEGISPQYEFPINYIGDQCNLT